MKCPQRISPSTVSKSANATAEARGILDGEMVKVRGGRAQCRVLHRAKPDYSDPAILGRRPCKPPALDGAVDSWIIDHLPSC